uniref:BAG family molecular chaperone regulator 3 n=1 Tax=Anthurium amnicola TaxID=1678845 RepID=A0A1D1Y659_9ARAE
MMRARTTAAPVFSPVKEKPYVVADTTKISSPAGGGSPQPEEVEWEVRPGGMLVQKRCSAGGDPSAAASAAVVRVRVAHGVARHEVSVSSQATFGELKKHLAGETGLQPAEQRLIYKGKERENSEYLDTCGVKNRSKVVLAEDPASVERRCIERQRMAKIENVNRAISDASMEIDKLADQVGGLS